MYNKNKDMLTGDSSEIALEHGEESGDMPSDQAIAWVARLQSDKVSNSDHQKFSNWLTASQINRDAFDEIADLWEDLAVVSQLPFELSPNSSYHNNTATEQTDRVASNGFTSSFGKWWLMAPGFAILALAVSIGWNAMLSPVEYSTQIGEQKTIALRDGSMLFLNTNSKVIVNLHDDVRSISLSYGEAFFDVAHDIERPFEVEACKVTARALGTAFNVRCDDDGYAQVTVSEGVVRVTSVEEQVELDASEQISYATTSGLSPLATINSDDITAWTRQLLIYDGVSLAEVVRDMNRYSDQKIIVANPELRALNVSGRFTMKDRLATLHTLEKSFPIEVVRRSSQILELIPAK